MKKSIFRWGLALCLLLGLLTTGVMATGEETTATHDTCSAHSEVETWTKVTTAANFGTAGTGKYTVAAGNYVLMKNVDLGENYLEITGNAIICLNGYTLSTSKDSSTYELIQLNGTKITLTVCDCSAAKTGTLAANGETKTKGYALATTYGTITLEDVTLTGGGAIAVGAIGSKNYGNIVIDGATIEGEFSYAISTASSTATGAFGSVKIEEGSTINGNVRVQDAEGSLTVNGGTVTGKVDSVVPVTINGGTVTGPLTIGGSLTMNGGTVTMSEGSSITDGVKLNGGTLNMDAGTITSTGTGVTMAEGSTFNMKDGSITNCVSGGVVVNKGTFNMSGGSITGNGSETLASAGGVNLTATGGTFNFSGGTISANKAILAPGVYVHRATDFNMSGTAAITGNIGYGESFQNAALVIGRNGNYARGAAHVAGGSFSGNVDSAGNACYDVAMLAGSYTQTGPATLEYGILVYPVGTPTTGDGVRNVTVAAGQVRCVDVTDTGVENSGVNIALTGGTFGYAEDDETFASYIPSDRPMSLKAVTVEGWENACEVDKGYKRIGSYKTFGSTLNFDVVLSCDNGFTTNAVAATVNGAEATATIDADGKVSVAATGIAAKDMGKDIAFVVKSADGQASYYSEEISVADVAAEEYVEAEGTAYGTLLEDMINYGNAAATVFDCTTVDALGDGTTELTQEWTRDAGDYGANEGAAHEMFATLSLKDKIELNIYHEDKVTTVDDIAIAEALGSSDVTFEDGCAVKYSIKDYILDVLHDGVENGQEALIEALQKYIDSVCAVVNG